LGGAPGRLDFAGFDTRGYRTVDVRTGYREWLPTYEDTVEDAMDIALLEELRTVDWSGRVADLACGTGRTATWLRSQGVEAIDGVDITPEMLERARERGAHDTLRERDVADTGLETCGYDLVVTSLVDEHLESLGPLYDEAFRLARPGGAFVHVGLHPHFLMATGMPTHFRDASGEPVAISTYVHLLGEHVTAGLAAGFALNEMREGVIDDRWIAIKPKWVRFRHHPFSVAFAWQKP
jgi:SAM-dependent methyltransferase